MRCSVQHRQDTGANRAGDSRGRHTTTARSLHALPGGACIIDTPGLRTLRLDADAATLSGVFDDIAQVRAALPLPRLPAPGRARLRGARAGGAGAPAQLPQAARELRRDTMSALERKEQRQQWKSRSRAARERDRDKRGDGP